MNLDWNSIRTIKGSQSNAFEELCAQLARAETPPDARFVRKGTHDAGVECYCKLQDGSEWGWQAKYFTASPTGTQWQELDESVKRALDKHPALTRYFVCIPVDRSDARIDGRQSALQRWEKHVAKWKCWAQERCMSVEFIWWGSSELFDRLSQPEHIGRVFFWFNERYFEGDWFGDRLKEAHDAAGSRYKQEIHVDLPILRELELFGRTVTAFDEIRSLAIDIRRMLQNVRYAFPDDEESSHDFDLVGLSQSIELDDLLRSGEEVLRAFAALEFTPASKISLDVIEERVTATRKLASKTSGRLQSVWNDYSLPHERESRSPYSLHPLTRLRGSLFSLQDQLSGVEFHLSHASEISNSSLLILNGMAGTGKTHLLCDLARRRIEMDAPTVLLLGQHFTVSEEPWTQVLQQLDLHEASAEQFVGALEAAAQAENCRALVVIDALNEGLGYKIWPNHLAAFLTRLEQSSWIGVVLSVRSTYENVIIPEDVLERAVTLAHEGFANREYDAVQTFFSHYGIEFLSAPILQPEFSNPLLLKMLCEGLWRRGETKLTKGLYGVTEFFGFYLQAVNQGLAKSLDYNPNDSLVEIALSRVGQKLADKGNRSLPMQEAREIVDNLLPNRGFSESLYRGLVTEGILLEDTDWMNSGSNDMVVSIAYERLADHIVVSYLLMTHLDVCEPKAAFAKGGGLAFLGNKGVFTRHGLIEALCIQVPERTGQELVRLAPELLNLSNTGQAFRQSIVWRELSAFSQDTRAVLNDLIRNEGDLEETLDALLTVATIENHPFNAELLNENLRRYSMPDRDAWWSTYLHHAWETETKGAVHRLVDWALGISSDDDLEGPVIDLSAITLAWMLTTSNRFLRDRATKALVSLLTGRLDATSRLIERFYDVDDPYVTERVYAVAYGVALRSHDAAAVGELASIVYERDFASGSPPAHILLRDYARGVIERALHLGSVLQVDENLVRPPYRSDWPDIPDENAIKMLMPNWRKGSFDSGELEWAWNHVALSVMDDDFARYVIGTNSGLTNWLSLRLVEDTWKSPNEQLRVWRSKLTEKERKAWEEYEENKRNQPIILNFGIEGDNEHDIVIFPGSGGTPQFENRSPTKEDHLKIELARQGLEDARKKLAVVLSADHLAEMESICQQQSEDRPNFDLSKIQRYVLWRVRDLGWTVERFERFDRYSVGSSGRDAAKAERIGKKYQWIAYHEILAYIADNYQYRGRYGEADSDRAYEGPWQEHLRDIDPSSTLEQTPGDPSWGGHNPSWWASCKYKDWDEGLGHEAWIKKREDFPAVNELLGFVRPKDGSRWLNANGFLLWRQPSPADLEPEMVDRREIWLRYSAYFIDAECASGFIHWANCADTWGTWLHEPSGVQDFYLGEYGWSQGFRHIFKPFYGHSDWEEPGDGCPTTVRPASFQYTAEVGTFDCSIEESFSLRLPHHDFVAKLGLKWSGNGTDFRNPHGSRVAFDPTVQEDGPSALLLREDCVKEYLTQNDLALVWIVQGEKTVLSKTWDRVRHPWHSVTGAFLYTDGKPIGRLRYRFDDSRE